MYNLGIARASIYNFRGTTINSGYREERFIEIKSGEIQEEIVLHDCTKKQYMEVIVFNESDREKLFPIEQNFQPICCTDKEVNCKKGSIKIAFGHEYYRRYIIRPTCTKINYTIPKIMKKRPDFVLESSEGYPIHLLNDTFKING